jgi:hypothetical protein
MDRQQLTYMIQALELAIEIVELLSVSALIYQKRKEEFFHASI